MHNEQSIHPEFYKHYRELGKLEDFLELLESAILGEEPQMRAEYMKLRDATKQKIQHEKAMCKKYAREESLVLV